LIGKKRGINDDKSPQATSAKLRGNEEAAEKSLRDAQLEVENKRRGSPI